jgi:hypothetical protein
MSSLDAIELAREGALINAVKNRDLYTVERLFDSYPDLDPMKRPKTGMEVIDYSDMARPQVPPCQYYGDCAVMEGIRTENLLILDMLLTRTPKWVGSGGMDFLKLVETGIQEGKLNALACILRGKGYPQVTGWDTEYDHVDYAMKCADRQKQKGAAHLLRLERDTPGYFGFGFDMEEMHIPTVVAIAEKL